MTQADVLLDRLVRSMQRGQVYQSIATILVVLVVMALAIWYVSEKSDRDMGIMLEVPGSGREGVRYPVHV